MTECCIRENTATNYFLLYDSSSSITLNNCSIDNNDCIYNGGSSPTLLGETSVNAYTFILALKFISTGYCDASFDTISGVSLSYAIEQVDQTTYQATYQTTYLTPNVSVSVSIYINNNCRCSQDRHCLHLCIIHSTSECMYVLILTFLSS